MQNNWLEELKKVLEKNSAQDSEIQFDRLREHGIINDQGEVTGHLRRWDASLAITAVKLRVGKPEIAQFRCLKPVFGMPGNAEIDICRESMLDYLRNGEKVITATWDNRLGMWKQGEHVRLTSQGYIRADASEDLADGLGGLPEFSQTRSLL